MEDKRFPKVDKHCRIAIQFAIAENHSNNFVFWLMASMIARM
jgi:hypothetical protein